LKAIEALAPYIRSLEEARGVEDDIEGEGKAEGRPEDRQRTQTIPELVALIDIERGRRLTAKTVVGKYIELVKVVLEMTNRRGMSSASSFCPSS
jgi:hypothetical protein